MNKSKTLARIAMMSIATGNQPPSQEIIAKHFPELKQTEEDLANIKKAQDRQALKLARRQAQRGKTSTY